jgi:hypothetical protein
MTEMRWLRLPLGLMDHPHSSQKKEIGGLIRGTKRVDWHPLEPSREIIDWVVRVLLFHLSSHLFRTHVDYIIFFRLLSAVVSKNLSPDEILSSSVYGKVIFPCFNDGLWIHLSDSCQLSCSPIRMEAMVRGLSSEGLVIMVTFDLIRPPDLFPRWDCSNDEYCESQVCPKVECHWHYLRIWWWVTGIGCQSWLTRGIVPLLFQFPHRF